MITVEIAQTGVHESVPYIDVEVVEVASEQALAELESSLPEHKWVLNTY